MYLFIANTFFIPNFKNLYLFFYFIPCQSFYSLLLISHLYSILNLLVIILFYYPLFHYLSHNKPTMSHIHIIPNHLLLFYCIPSYLSYSTRFTPSILSFKISHLVYNFFSYLVKILLTCLLP